MVKIDQLELNNGITMPQLGLGVWQVKDGDEVLNSILYALKIGYRAIDTAAIYGNEIGVGEAINQSKITRNELFITSKLWTSDQGYESTLKAFDASLARLDLDYLDLYLIHWPSSDKKLISETWRAFEKLYKEGKVMAIGVSNFTIEHLEDLLETAKIIPVVNQVELHPYKSQLELRQFCNEHSIKVESWSPLMHGGEVLNNPTIMGIAKVHNKSPAQVILHWHIQNGLIVIPKSITPERIKENIEIFDFILNKQEMEQINSLDQEQGSMLTPDSLAVKFYTKFTKLTNSVNRKNKR